MSEHDLAEALIAEHGTPDDSYEELMELLLSNGVSEEVAEEVVSDIRG